MGEMFDALRLLANHSKQAGAFIDFALSVRGDNTLTPVQYKLAYTTASAVNRCHY